MNEQFKKLAESIPELEAWGAGNGDNFSEALEAFAELLVKECMKLTSGFTHPRHPVTGATRIGGHFGVEL